MKTPGPIAPLHNGDIETDQASDGGQSPPEVWTGRAAATWPRRKVLP